MSGITAFEPTPQIGMDLAEGKPTEIADQTRTFVRSALVPLLSPSTAVISIDGMDGAGKTTLGRELAAVFDAAFLDLDDFLDKERGRYFSALRFESLKSAIDAEARVVLAGCLMAAVLRKIERTPDFRIYVVRTARMRSQPDLEWVDERDILLEDTPADELIADLEESTRKWAHADPPFGGGDAKMPELPKELIRYHRQFTPHRTASLIVRLARVNS